MSFSIIAFIKAIILPPTINFIAAITGLLLKKYKFFSKSLIYLSSISLFLFCLSPFADFLLKGLEKYPAIQLPATVKNEQAIVVLSAGSQPSAIEFGKDIDGIGTLQRNRYAAFLNKQMNLPLLVSGGLFEPNEFSEVEVMANTLKDSFNVEVEWLEGKSKNTAENAIYSAEILKQNGIDTIFLVTHAWHMPRAVMMFEQQGLKVTPAPTIFVSDGFNTELIHYIPSAAALYKTKIALHEYIGMIWYSIRY